MKTENKIRGLPVMWKSEKRNIAILYNKDDFGAKFKIYHKVIYPTEGRESWRFEIAFHDYGETLNYAAMFRDAPAER